MSIAYKQFIFGDPIAWIKDAKPCGLRNAVKRATGTTCFVYQRGEMVKTFDVRELFQSYLKKVGHTVWRHQHWDDVAYLCICIKARMSVKQDHGNKLLQKIRKLV